MNEKIDENNQDIQTVEYPDWKEIDNYLKEKNVKVLLGTGIMKLSSVEGKYTK